MLQDWTFRTTPLSLSKEEIVRSIEFLNANYEVLNTDKYGQLQNVEIVLVVQVNLFKIFTVYVFFRYFIVVGYLVMITYEIFFYL